MALQPESFLLCFFQHRYVWGFFNSHYPIQQCVVVYWARNNIWRFKSGSDVMYWLKVSFIFFRFRLQASCQTQTSNHHWTIRAMSVYLIVNQWWQYYLSKPASTKCFLMLKLLSFCSRLCCDIINEVNGSEHDICSLRKLSICLFDVVHMMNLENGKASHWLLVFQWKCYERLGR